MKLLAVLGLIYLTTNSFTQTNEFAPIGATWWYDDIYGIDYDDTLYITGYNRVESISEAIIDGINCRELKFSFYDASGNLYDEIVRYVYENNEKVYFYNEDDFKLVYNFTGEDWYAHDIYYGSEDSALIIVDSVVFEMYDAELLKTIYVHTDFTTTLTYISKKIVEKIGPLCYFYLYNEGDDSFPPSGLRCYADNEIDYHVNETIPCDSVTPEVTTIEVVQSTPFEITIFNNIVAISDITETLDVSFVNTLGETVLSRTVNANLEFEIDHFPKGNYILLLKTRDQFYSYKIYAL